MYLILQFVRTLEIAQSNEYLIISDLGIQVLAKKLEYFEKLLFEKNNFFNSWLIIIKLHMYVLYLFAINMSEYKLQL